MKEIIDIQSTIPDFVKDKYPRFVNFIESYFEHLEEPNNFLDILENFNFNLDFDNAIDSTVDNYLSELGLFKLKELNNIKIDKKLLLKSLHELNALSGSAEGFKLFFRIFFDSFCEIKKPNLFILSNSDFVHRQYLIVTTNEIKDLQPYSTKALSGNYLESTNSSFLNSSSIEALYFIIINGIKYAKLEINKPIKNFTVNESIKIVIKNRTYYENTVRVAQFDIVNSGVGYTIGDSIRLNTQGLARVENITSGGYSSYTIISPGTNYSIGDSFKILDSTGSHFLAVVSKISLTGAIQEIDIINPGFNYIKGNTNNIKINKKNNSGTTADIKFNSNDIGKIVDIRIVEDFINFNLNSPVTLSSSTGSGAVLTIKPIANYQEFGYFKNAINVLGNNYYIQDCKTHLHQNSYIINSKVSKNYSEKLIDEYLHPTGLDKYLICTVETR
jgi:hypothetical protein